MTWPGAMTGINAMVESGTWAALSDASRAVWLVLAKRANNKTGRCWPSVGSIARDAGKSRTATYRAIRELESAGLIHRDSATGGAPTNTTTYTLQPVPQAAGQPVPCAAPVPQAVCQPVPCAGQTRTAGGTRIPKETPSESPMAGAAAEAGTGDNGKARVDPVAVTFTTADGKPWHLLRPKLLELREKYPFVHVDSELDGLAAWAEANPNRRPRASGVWSWMRRLLARKQSDRPLDTPAHYGDGWTHTNLPTDPTARELAAIFAEVNP